MIVVLCSLKVLLGLVLLLLCWDVATLPWQSYPIHLDEHYRLMVRMAIFRFSFVFPDKSIKTLHSTSRVNPIHA